jgi:hypothetical protein
MWAVTSASKENVAAIFRVGVNRVGMWMGRMGKIEE